MSPYRSLRLERVEDVLRVVMARDLPREALALGTAFDYSTALEMTTLRSEDHKEALRAVRERRTPRFQGS